MFKDSELGKEAYENYYDLVYLGKQKGASFTKLEELKRLLNYFNNNYDSFNDEEEKLIKNVIMVSNGIISKVNNRYGQIRLRKESCLSLIDDLKANEKSL